MPRCKVEGLRGIASLQKMQISRRDKTPKEVRNVHISKRNMRIKVAVDECPNWMM